MGTLRFRPGGALFMLPAFALYGLFFIVPFARTMFGTACSNGTAWTDARFIGLGNYVQLAQDTLFLTGFGRVALVVTARDHIQGRDCVGSREHAARADTRRAVLYRRAFFVPVVISSAAISLMFTLLYDPDIGLVDVVLRGIGFGQFAHAWLVGSEYALLAVIAVPIWHTIGYFFVIIFAAMRNISRNL